MARKRDPVEVISCGACGYEGDDTMWNRGYLCIVCDSPNVELYVADDLDPDRFATMSREAILAEMSGDQETRS